MKEIFELIDLTTLKNILISDKNTDIKQEWVDEIDKAMINLNDNYGKIIDILDGT